MLQSAEWDGWFEPVRPRGRGARLQAFAEDWPCTAGISNATGGEQVQIVSGKDKGKQGEVKEVHRKYQRVTVEGLNLVKRHVAGQGSQPGKIITKSMPVALANVAHIDPTTGGPTRVRFGFLGDGTKVRIAVKSGAIIPKPVWQRRRPHPDGGTKRDTQKDVVVKVTATEEELMLHRVLRELTLSRDPNYKGPREAPAAPAAPTP